MNEIISSQEYDDANIIYSKRAADDWADGYPIGNGRIGAMVIGDPLEERIALNHDLLWRRYWTYQERHIAQDIPLLRRLCSEDRWDDANDLLFRKLPISSSALYVNPMVPAGDMGIYPYHSNKDVTDYKRHLDMESGRVEISYSTGGVKFLREYFCPWQEGILLTRLSADRLGSISGEVTLSRLLDPDCIVTGSSKLGEIVLNCEFEEGIRFAVVVRIIQAGGRLTGGRASYLPPSGEMPQKDLKLEYVFRKKDKSDTPVGVSTCFDRADEVIILTAISTDNETGMDPVELCKEKLYSISTDYNEIKTQHIKDFQEFYRRSYVNLGALNSRVPTDEQIRFASESKKVPKELIQKLFNMGRYLAIASGRPLKDDKTSKAPMTLQGIWNQDRLPAWDCDYHLDLNLEMCYWPLEILNLGELMEPLMAWVERLMPQARKAALDLYGCRGIAFSISCDNNNIGGSDDYCAIWSGAAAWIGQILWQHWQYSGDIDFLKNRLYPFLKEVALFYEDFLTTNAQGKLIPCPSGSPEMAVKGRKVQSMLSSPSTIDIELIREVFTNVLYSSKLFGIDENKCEIWRNILKKVPMPIIDKEGCLQEWMENHEPVDPGHRHRSHLIGLCPGERITLEETPDYLEGVRKALLKRQKYGYDTATSFSFAWDAQMFARLYDAESSLKQLNLLMQTNILGNLLITINDWAGTGKGIPWFKGSKVFQIEASICVAAAIAEMIFQDRRGLLRLLPALPNEWDKGKAGGFRGRGGFEVDIEWKEHCLQEARIKSLRGGQCRIKTFNASNKKLEVLCRNEIISTKLTQDIIEFGTVTGETYILKAL